MNRYARDKRESQPKPVERIELNEDKLPQRLILVAVLLVIGIAALGAACDFERSRLSQSLAKMHTLRELFAARIGAVGSGARINTPPVCAEHIISLTLPCVRSETLVRALSNEGICISNGSACSSHGSHRKKSVLEAFGLSADEADSTVRISLCPDNSESDVIAAADAIAENVKKLAHK